LNKKKKNWEESLWPWSEVIKKKKSEPKKKKRFWGEARPQKRDIMTGQKKDSRGGEKKEVGLGEDGVEGDSGGRRAPKRT